jgi:DNA polymerase-1
MLVLKQEASSNIGTQIKPSPKKNIKQQVFYVLSKAGLLEIEPYIYQNKIRHVFIDTETTGLDPINDDIVLIQIHAGNHTYIINTVPIGIDKDVGYFYNGIRKIFGDQDIIKIFHNAKFDISFLRHHLFHDIRFVNVFDTYLAEKLLTAGISKRGDHSLSSVVKKYTGYDLDKSQQTSFSENYELTKEQLIYAVNDVLALKPVFQKQRELLMKFGLVDTAMLEFSIIPAVVDIELSGMLIDVDKLSVMKKSCTEQLNELENQLNRYTETIDKGGSQLKLFKNNSINFNSPVQVKSILHKLGYSVESTAMEILKKIDHPFAQTLVKHRKNSKLISSFINKLPNHINPVTGRIHPEFYQLGTEAGRFTCQNPNLQQIPKVQTWRDLFKAPEGYKILTADYSQIELRIMAEYSQDPAFLEAYRAGKDLHSKTAADMFNVTIDQVTKEQRNIAKTINFGLCYGMTSKGLSERLNIDSDRAEHFINQYYRSYPQVKATLQQLGVKAISTGYATTLLGRKRYFKAASSFGAQKSLERKGRNTPIQGTCADILKKAIDFLQHSLTGYDAKIINLVHDEIVVEVTKDQTEKVKKIVEKDMVQAGQDFIKSIPVEVDIIVDNVWRK